MLDVINSLPIKITRVTVGSSYFEVRVKEHPSSTARLPYSDANYTESYRAAIDRLRLLRSQFGDENVTLHLVRDVTLAA